LPKLLNIESVLFFSWSIWMKFENIVFLSLKLQPQLLEPRLDLFEMKVERA